MPRTAKQIYNMMQQLRNDVAAGRISQADYERAMAGEQQQFQAAQTSELAYLDGPKSMPLPRQSSISDYRGDVYSQMARSLTPAQRPQGSWGYEVEPRLGASAMRQGGVSYIDTPNGRIPVYRGLAAEIGATVGRNMGRLNVGQAAGLARPVTNPQHKYSSVGALTGQLQKVMDQGPKQMLQKGFEFNPLERARQQYLVARQKAKTAQPIGRETVNRQGQMTSTLSPQSDYQNQMRQSRKEMEKYQSAGGNYRAQEEQQKYQRQLDKQRKMLQGYRPTTSNKPITERLIG